MSIFVALHHVTHYKYDRPIDLGPQTIRLRPAPHTRTPILSYSLKVTPSNHFVNWQQDPQGNWLARFVFPEKASELKIEVDFTAQMTVINPFDFFVEPYADSFPFAYTDDLKTELAPYLATIEPGPLFAKYLAGIPREATSTVNFLVDLNAKLRDQVRYIIRMEPGIQTPEQTLASGAGSCRDSAWLLIQTLRHLGLAARFVSGYLIQLRPDIDPVEGPREVENDFTDLHAWAEVYLPGAGWIGFGCKPAPSIKLATNSAMYRRMEDDMDVNCGTILDGEETVQQCGQRIFELMLKTASGQPTKSESFDFGGAEFAPWVLGATM